MTTYHFETDMSLPKTYEINGRIYTVKQAAIEFGLSVSGARARLNKLISLELDLSLISDENAYKEAIKQVAREKKRQAYIRKQSLEKERKNNSKEALRIFPFDTYRVDGIYYKRGLHGFVYHYTQFKEWKRSHIELKDVAHERHLVRAI